MAAKVNRIPVSSKETIENNEKKKFESNPPIFGGGCTVKTLFTDEDGTHWLVPQNDDYDAIRHLSLFERRCQKYKKYKYKKYNQYGVEGERNSLLNHDCVVVVDACDGG